MIVTSRDQKAKEQRRVAAEKTLLPRNRVLVHLPREFAEREAVGRDPVQHRRYNHRPDDGFRSVKCDVASDPYQRQNSGQHGFERQLQQLERADARRPDPERHELRPDRHAMVAQQPVA